MTLALRGRANNWRPLSRLTVYQFGSRRALLDAVFDDQAERGGLHRVAEAMAAADPFAGLQELIEIFCEFWSFDRDALARLHSAGMNDAELEESVRARNERRHRALSVLVNRIADRKEIHAEARKDLIDTLFALTSFHVFAELTAAGRSVEAAGDGGGCGPARLGKGTLIAPDARA
jgi:AcrR family transcriptional regulator